MPAEVDESGLKEGYTHRRIGLELEVDREVGVGARAPSGVGETDICVVLGEGCVVQEAPRRIPPMTTMVKMRCIVLGLYCPYRGICTLTLE